MMSPDEMDQLFDQISGKMKNEMDGNKEPELGIQPRLWHHWDFSANRKLLGAFWQQHQQSISHYSTNLGFLRVQDHVPFF